MWYDNYKKFDDKLKPSTNYIENSPKNINWLIYNSHETYKLQTGESPIQINQHGQPPLFILEPNLYHPKLWIDEFLDGLNDYVNFIIFSPNTYIPLDEWVNKSIETRTARIYRIDEFIKELEDQDVSEKSLYIFNCTKFKSDIDNVDCYEVRYVLVEDDELARKKQQIKKRDQDIDDLLK